MRRIFVAGFMAAAMTQGALADCKSITDPKERLACYDGGDVVAASSGDKMSLMDLKIDRAQMKGKPVVVRGHISLLGDMATLGAEAFDTTPLFLEMKGVSRDQRKAILTKCNMGCTATVSGKVGAVMMQDGIIASSIIVD